MAAEHCGVIESLSNAPDDRDWEAVEAWGVCLVYAEGNAGRALYYFERWWVERRARLREEGGDV